MFEAALAIGILLAVLGGAAGYLYAPWTLLWGLGAGLILFGLLVGVPAGLWYHLLLYRALAPRSLLAKRWWLNPTSLHRHLSESRSRLWMLPFALGAFGFLACMAGCLLVALGALRAR